MEAETEDSWSWFIGLLLEDLDLLDGRGWVFMSDQQKVLIYRIPLKVFL